MAVASPTKSRAEQVILLPALVFCSLSKAAFGYQLLEGATFFYRQLVCGNMFWAEIQGPFEGVSPNIF